LTGVLIASIFKDIRNLIVTIKLIPVFYFYVKPLLQLDFADCSEKRYIRINQNIQESSPGCSTMTPKNIFQPSLQKGVIEEKAIPWDGLFFYYAFKMFFSKNLFDVIPEMHRYPHCI
jgi:hypothetical protein